MRSVLGTDVSPLDEEMIALAYARRQQQYDDTHGPNAVIPVGVVGGNTTTANELNMASPPRRPRSRQFGGQQQLPGSSTHDDHLFGGDELGASRDGGGFQSPVVERPDSARSGKSSAVVPSVQEQQPSGKQPVPYGAAGYKVGLSFEDCLAIFFPYVTLRDADPRLLTVDEAEAAANTAELARLQLAKMEAYMEAAGALSPSQLDALHKAHRQSGGSPADFLNLIREAAVKHASSVEAAMCRGLTYNELEGLRCAWCELHPAVHGDLTDVEIENFYAKTHDGARLMSREHYVKWRTTLDVRKRGSISFAEYCFPFAQRALLRIARSELARRGKEVIVGPRQKPDLTRDEILEQFGEAIADACLLPFEIVVPVERVLATTLKSRR